MSTTIKPELSERSKYWIDKHRYYELKHFCLQYPFWRRSYTIASAEHRTGERIIVKNSKVANPTEDAALRLVFFSERIKLIERVATETDSSLASYILKAVTTGISYDLLRAQTSIPCCRDVYYEYYRKFFWLLDKERA